MRGWRFIDVGVSHRHYDYLPMNDSLTNMSRQATGVTQLGKEYLHGGFGARPRLGTWVSVSSVPSSALFPKEVHMGTGAFRVLLPGLCGPDMRPLSLRQHAAYFPHWDAAAKWTHRRPCAVHLAVSIK